MKSQRLVIPALALALASLALTSLPAVAETDDERGVHDDNQPIVLPGRKPSSSESVGIDVGSFRQSRRSLPLLQRSTALYDRWLDLYGSAWLINNQGHSPVMTFSSHPKCRVLGRMLRKIDGLVEDERASAGRASSEGEAQRELCLETDVGGEAVVIRFAAGAFTTVVAEGGVPVGEARPSLRMHILTPRLRFGLALQNTACRGDGDQLCQELGDLIVDMERVIKEEPVL